MHAWSTSMLLLLHSPFILSVIKLLLKGEVGVCALNSHGNYIVNHGKIMELCFLSFSGNPVITIIIIILFSLHQIQDLDNEEETLVKKTESEVKELNFRIRVNGLENERRELLKWSKTDKPPGDQKQRQSVGTNSTNKDVKTDRKSVIGASRTTTTPPSKTEGIQTKGKRPLSDQGARGDLPPPGKSSASEPRSLQKFFKQFKPSKPAWNK